MEAVEFIRQRNRMCVYYNSMSEGCYACPAFNAAYHNDCKISTDNPKHLVEIVEQWAREHPDKPEREQQKPEQGTVGYLNPAAFKEYYAPYQSVKDLERLYEELADRIAQLEKDNAETMHKMNRPIDDEIRDRMLRKIVLHKDRIEDLEHDASEIRHNLAALHDKIYTLLEKKEN